MAFEQTKAVIDILCKDAADAVSVIKNGPGLGGVLSAIKDLSRVPVLIAGCAKVPAEVAGASEADRAELDAYFATNFKTGDEKLDGVADNIEKIANEISGLAAALLHKA